MYGFGLIELSVVFILVLLLFGPQELPKLARFIARFIHEMKSIFKNLEKEWNLFSEEKKPAHRKPPHIEKEKTSTYEE